MTAYSPLGHTLFGDDAVPFGETALSREFIVPPMSLLDTETGRWQERKRAWLALGLRSELGRGESGGTPDDRGTVTSRLEASRATNVTGAPPVPEWAGNKGLAWMAPGTSMFDPVLCEVLLHWYAPQHATVYDPFAGGSVRGILSALLGHTYLGIELRPEQCASNREQWVTQATRVQDVTAPEWICGDAYEAAGLLPAGLSADLILSCPPYADLEVYSDDPRDLSHIAVRDYPQFLERYRHIIRTAADVLSDDRFATWVVGEVRDRRGNCRNFVGDTISAFVDAGLHLYNDAVLLNPIGSGALRAGKAFRASRKLVRRHQNVLVFVKGDGKRAAQAVQAEGSGH
jgi:hypothetical protein